MSLEAATYSRHAAYSALRGPAIALTTQFASFVAMKSFGASEQLALLMSYAMPVGNILAYFWVRFMASRARLPFAFWPDLLGFLVLLPLAWVGHAETFVVVMMLTTIMRSSTIVALSSIIRENYPSEARASILGRVQSWSLGAQALSGYLFGYILENDPNAYRYLFPLVGVLGIAAVMSLRGMPELDPSERKSTASPSVWDFVRVLRADSDFFRFQVTTFIHGFAAIMFLALLPMYLANELRVDYREGAIALVVITSLLPVLTGRFWGRLIDRTNILYLRGFFNIVWAMSPFAVFFWPNIWGVYLSQILIGLILGGSTLLWQLGINIYARKEETVTYMGIHQSLTGLRGLLAPLAGIWFVEHWGARGAAAYLALFVVCGLMMLSAGVFMLIEARYLERKGAATTFAMAEEQEQAG